LVEALVLAMLFTAPDFLLIVLSKLVTRRIYVQYIDLSEEFDKVNHHGSYLKLMKQHLPPEFCYFYTAR